MVYTVSAAAVAKVYAAGIREAAAHGAASTPVKRPGFVSIVADVPLGRSSTIYKQVGDLFAWLMGVGAIGLAVISIRSDRSETS